MRADAERAYKLGFRSCGARGRDACQWIFGQNDPAVGCAHGEGVADAGGAYGRGLRSCGSGRWDACQWILRQNDPAVEIKGQFCIPALRSTAGMLQTTCLYLFNLTLPTIPEFGLHIGLQGGEQDKIRPNFLLVNILRVLTRRSVRSDFVLLAPLQSKWSPNRRVINFATLLYSD